MPSKKSGNSRFMLQLRCGAAVFSAGFKKRIVRPLSAFLHWLYRLNYVTGIQTVRRTRRIGKKLRVFLTPFGRFLFRAADKLLLRHLRRIAAECSRFASGFSLAGTQIRQGFSRGFFSGLFSVISLPFLAFRRHKGALAALFNVVAPVAAAIALIVTVSYWSSLTFALELRFAGKTLGYIADETVYNNAAASVEDKLINPGDSFVIERVPTLTVAVVPKDEILDEAALQEKLMNAMSDTISPGAGLYVDGSFVGAVEDSLQLNQIIIATLAAQRDGSGEDVASFVDDLQIKEGLFPTDSFIPLSTVKGYIEQLDVQVTRLISYEEKIAFSKETVKDKSKYLGYSRVRTKGVDGIVTHIAQVVYVNGEKVSQTVLSSEKTKNPVTQVTVVGAMTYTAGTTLGDGKATGKMIWPVPFTKRISSYFGSRDGGYHHGLDISSTGINGQAILACDGGTVIKANRTDKWGSGWGYYVLIDHGNGYQTRYAHCKEVVVKVGQKVAQGQLIGYVGNTGKSTGPHLHLEVLLNGTRVNPLPYLKASGTY